MSRPPVYDSAVERLLLILPSATYRAPDFLAAARELGVAVTVASERRAAMAAARGGRALTPRLSGPGPAAARSAERVRGILSVAREPPGSALLLESYLPGAEVAVEGLLRGGCLEVLAVFDKPDPLEGPYFEETLYVTPSRLPTAVLGEVESIT